MEALKIILAIAAGSLAAKLTGLGGFVGYALFTGLAYGLFSLIIPTKKDPPDEEG